MRLEVYRKSHGRREKGRLVSYGVGDQFEGTQKELRAFADRLREVESEAQETPESQPDSLDTLRSEAESLGVEVDGRWGEKRLRAEIDKALENDSEA